MHRPEVPRAWRIAVGATGALVLFLVIVNLAEPDVPAFARDALDPAQVAWGGIAGALAVGMARAGGRDRIAALAGIGLGVLFALVASSPFAFLVGLGIGVPVALVAARPHPIALPLVVIGLAGMLLAYSTLAKVGPTPAMQENEAARGLIFAGIGALLALGLLGYALVARSPPASRMPRRTRIAIALAGAGVLMLSFLIGGHVFWLPLWPLAFGLLVLPAMWEWVAWPLGAALVAAVVLAGLAQVGPCTFDPWTDAQPPGFPDTIRTHVPLASVGAMGPFWREGGDGFSGERVTCPAGTVALGAAWDAALVAAALAFARRDQR